MALFFNTLAVLLTILVSAIHYYAIEYSLYWFYSAIDIIPHALAGLAVGAWSGAVGSRLSLRPSRMALFALCATLAVSVAWEIMEFSLGLTRIEPALLGDTTIDLVSAFVGSMLIVPLYIVLYKKYRQ